MPTPSQAAIDYTSAVLLRGCINELRFPRICRSRFCRRNHVCRDTGNGEPRCLAALHEIDHRALMRLFRLIIEILAHRYPPRPSHDAAQYDLEDDAIVVIFDCLEALPDQEPWFLDWVDRYHTPPAPPVDTAALLAEMKATLAHDKLLSDFQT